MPNGDHYTLAEHQELDAFVRPMYSVIEEFATTIKAELIDRNRFPPDRIISFQNTNKHNAQIGIFPRLPESGGKRCFVDASVFLDCKPVPGTLEKTS